MSTTEERTTTALVGRRGSASYRQLTICSPPLAALLTTRYVTTHYPLLTLHYLLRHYSLPTTHHSLLATRYSLPTTYYSLLDIHYSLLDIHYSLLNTYSLMARTHHSPLCYILVTLSELTTCYLLLTDYC